MSPRDHTTRTSRVREFAAEAVRLRHASWRGGARLRGDRATPRLARLGSADSRIYSAGKTSPRCVLAGGHQTPSFDGIFVAMPRATVGLARGKRRSSLSPPTSLTVHPRRPSCRSRMVTRASRQAHRLPHRAGDGQGGDGDNTQPDTRRASVSVNILPPVISGSSDLACFVGIRAKSRL